MCLSCSYAVCSVYNVIQVKRNPTEMSHPERSIFRSLCGLFPFIYMVTVSYWWLCLWPALVTDYLVYFIPFIGLLFGHQVGRMITAHVAKMEFPYWNSSSSLILTTGLALAYLDTQTTR